MNQRDDKDKKAMENVQFGCIFTIFLFLATCVAMLIGMGFTATFFWLFG